MDKKLQSDHSLEERCIYTRETVLALLKLCLDCTHFKFRENHYALEDGLTMGSPVSPPVANLFMEKFEIEALASFEKEKPKHWRRYVDDVLAVVKASVANDLLPFDEQLSQEHGIHYGNRRRRKISNA